MARRPNPDGLGGPHNRKPARGRDMKHLRERTRRRDLRRIRKEWVTEMNIALTARAKKAPPPAQGKRQPAKAERSYS